MRSLAPPPMEAGPVFPPTLHRWARRSQVGLIDADICGPSLPRLVGVRQEEVHMSNDGWEPVAVDETVSVVSVGFMLQQLDQAVIFQGAQKVSRARTRRRITGLGHLLTAPGATVATTTTAKAITKATANGGAPDAARAAR